MYKFYLGDILLPVAPSELNVKVENQNEILNLLNDGQFNVLKRPGLKEYSFRAMLPVFPYHFLENFNFPNYYIEHIENLKNNKKIFDFSVIDNYSSQYLNKLVSLESYSILDKDDIYIDIVLKEYKSFSTKVLSVSDDILKADKEENRVDTSTSSGSSYTVVSGDTLSGIALKKYGDSNRWKEIYEYNKEVIDSEARKRGYSSNVGKWIFPGTVLTLP